MKAQREWEKCPIEKRLEIWLKAANLMSKKYRQHLNAATMLGQSKSVIQAEIDSAAELIDFFKIQGYYVKDALKYKPISPTKTVLNSLRYRGMDGFVAAVSPFNFTAIGGNLSYTPALMVRIFLISLDWYSREKIHTYFFSLDLSATVILYREMQFCGNHRTPHCSPIGGSSKYAEKQAYRRAL